VSLCLAVAPTLVGPPPVPSWVRGVGGWIRAAQAWIRARESRRHVPHNPATPYPSRVGRSANEASAARAADVQLVTSVLAGDTTAQSTLLARLLPHLRVVARSIVRNPADVDDGIQVALMRVLDGLGTYRGDAGLVRWARRVAAHACLRLEEREARRLKVVDQAAASATPTSTAPSAALQESLPQHVVEYLDRLPPPQREALILRHVLDYTVPEIAELLDTPVDTVKSRLLYGRRALRKVIRHAQARDAAPKFVGGER